MMIGPILIFLSILNYFYGANFLYANDLSKVQGMIVPVENSKAIVEEGDFGKVVIRFWPLDKNDKKTVDRLQKAIDGKIFLDYFYIYNIYQTDFSKNNDVVLEFYCQAVLKRAFQKEKLKIWNIGNKNIPIMIKKFTTKIFKERKKDYTVYPYSFKVDLGREKSYFFWWVILFSILFVYLRYRWVKYRKAFSENKREYLKRSESWRSLIISVKGRKDLQFIYDNRKEWHQMLKVDDQNDFFKLMKVYQYKKKWNEKESSNITTAMEKIQNDLTTT